MRLLKYDRESCFSLSEFVGNDAPRYAILSHTWGPDHEEVTFGDFIRGTYKTKIGFKKIQFCANQAYKDNLLYFWVDTCCIDKSSSAELTEAINSMFAWYRDSARCYVYLPDVSVDESTSADSSHESWMNAFRQSRWFTRGWTLQELIAPSSVEFFSGEGRQLGDKSSIVQEIHEITGISVEVLLQKKPIHEFSIEERMSWPGKRETKREEDLAYSLLGIFDVQMPLIYGEGRKKALARLRREISTQADDMRTTIHTHEPFSTIPFAPDADYVDRPDIVAWMVDKSAKGSAHIALVGIGGVGKSQIAIQYAHRMREVAPSTHVFWIHASTQAQFKEAFRSLAARLGISNHLDKNVDMLKLVRDWLCDERNGQWLMVIDNVDDFETFFSPPSNEQDVSAAGSISLQAYLPQSRGSCTLFTSRNRDVAAKLTGGYHNIKQVLAMDENQGLSLLRNKLPTELYEEASARKLLHALDYMPLAITQAAAYIGRRARMTITSYLSEFHANGDRRESLLHQDAGDLRRNVTASNSVVTTWQMSFERIRQERPSATELLSLMSFFNPQNIPEQPLRKFHQWYNKKAKRIPDVHDENEAALRMFDEDVDTLHAYSFVKVARTTMASEDDTLDMHALVQFCTRVWLRSYGESDKWEGACIETLASVFPNESYENWRLCERLLPHVELLYDCQLSDKILIRAWTHVQIRAAWYMYRRGWIPAAHAVMAKAVAAMRREFDLDDTQEREDATMLSVTLSLMGKFEESETLFRQLLEWFEGHEADDSYYTKLCISVNFSNLLASQGKHEEARRLNEEMLEEREKESGSYHLHTLRHVQDLADSLFRQERYDEARILARRVLTGREKELGPHHPDTLTSANLLGTILKYEGKYKEAEQLYRRALQGFEVELGAEHTQTLMCMYDLACVLRDRGEHEEASELYRRALTERDKVFGHNSLASLDVAFNLACSLHTLGRFDEAVTMYQRANDGLLQELGPQHPQVITCSRNLSALQQDMSCGASVDTVHAQRPLVRPASKHDSLLARIKRRGLFRKDQ